MKRPRMLDATLSLANRDPFADALEIFEGDAATGVFGLRNQLFGYDVVHVAGKPGFFSAALLQEPLDGLGAFCLKSCSQFSVAFPQAIRFASRIGVPVRVGGDVDDAQVDTQEIGSDTGRRIFDVAGLVQIEGTIVINQVGLSLPGLEQHHLPLTGKEGNALSASDCPDRDGLVRQAPGQDALVIGNGTQRFESTPSSTIELVGISHLGEHPHNNLRRESEPFAQLVVECSMQVELAERLVLPSVIAYVIGSGVGRFQRTLESVRLLRRRVEFYLGDQFHGHSVPQNSTLENGVKGTFLRLLKAVKESARFL